jgi:hypothetical protein
MATTSPKSGTTTSAVTPLQRSLWKRLLVGFVMLLLLVAVGGFGFLYYRSNQLINSEPYQAVLKFVTESETVKSKLTGPLTEPSFMDNLRNSSTLPAEGERAEALIKMTLLSNNQPLDVQSTVMKENTDWVIKDLNVRFPGEQQGTSLRKELSLKYGGDTPKFDPNQQPKTNDTKINLPPPDTDIKIDIGDLPTVPEK